MHLAGAASNNRLSLYPKPRGTGPGEVASMFKVVNHSCRLQ
jgi:hypothetical protein